MGPAVKRVEEQWPAIIKALEFLRSEEKASEILRVMEIPSTRYWLKFLYNALTPVENLNGSLQTNDAIFPRIYDRIEKLLRKTLSNFVATILSQTVYEYPGC